MVRVDTLKTLTARLIRVSVLYILVASGDSCGPSEFKSSRGECCPMCNIGSVVYRDCVEDSSTTCIPCSPGTFMSEPNGLYKCFPCNNCHESRGLYIKSRCSTIKDTVCEVLDGYYCIDNSHSQCLHAQKHSACKPGQEIKTAGTKRSDTVCEDCPSGFYSPAGVNCIRWTDCEARNEMEMEAGSSVKDVTCTQKRRDRYGLIPPLSVAVIVTITLLSLCLRQQTAGREPKLPIEETNPACHMTVTHQTPEEHAEEEETMDVSSSPPVTAYEQPDPTLLPT